MTVVLLDLDQLMANVLRTYDMTKPRYAYRDWLIIENIDACKYKYWGQPNKKGPDIEDCEQAAGEKNGQQSTGYDV